MAFPRATSSPSTTLFIEVTPLPCYSFYKELKIEIMHVKL